MKRNPNYWKHDGSGRPLPYIDSVRLYIQQNRDIELLRLVRGEIDFIDSLDAEYYDKLAAQAPKMVSDAGVSLDAEQMWVDQVPESPLPAYKKAWFRSTNFRRAISASINREDLGAGGVSRSREAGRQLAFPRQQVLVQCQAGAASL